MEEKNLKKAKKISVVIACYLDGLAIPVMYERLKKTFKKIGVEYEIIFINDASPDDTSEVLEKICSSDINVIGVTHSRSFGGQAGFMSGMEISRGDAIVLMDGDLQDPPELIEDFYKKWLEGYDVVYGVRTKRQTSIHLGYFYKLFYRLFNFMSYIKIPNDAGDFSLIDRRVVNYLIRFPETDQYIRGLRAWVGFKQIGVSYFRPERMFGKSTNNWISNIWWAKKAIFSFSFQPLAWITLIGIILTSISFLGIIIQVALKIFYPDTAPQGFTTLAVLILFFGGINLLAISFVGEYISKIFEETKNRPKFIRNEILIGTKKHRTIKEIKLLLKERNSN